MTKRSAWNKSNHERLQLKSFSGEDPVCKIVRAADDEFMPEGIVVQLVPNLHSGAALDIFESAANVSFNTWPGASHNLVRVHVTNSDLGKMDVRCRTLKMEAIETVREFYLASRIRVGIEGQGDGLNSLVGQCGSIEEFATQLQRKLQGNCASVTPGGRTQGERAMIRTPPRSPGVPQGKVGMEFPMST